jgi:hypothetical protein
MLKSRGNLTINQEVREREKLEAVTHSSWAALLPWSSLLPPSHTHSSVGGGSGWGQNRQVRATPSKRNLASKGPNRATQALAKAPPLHRCPDTWAKNLPPQGLSNPPKPVVSPLLELG